ncbi:hypothetical protein Brsp07_04144 [Brucella sp. NBRC 14130]|uniref:Uncharacterized protein n=1 Tax=Rhizobium subbaraonis TaxID=908946 RepID=A0A285UYC4_9HYPH|nr:hypothetical protein [Rhizobium subbaraonis]SOC46793.1 hypothetical protein SAMN05892877_12444 [Rhizobium subbaraonis]
MNDDQQTTFNQAEEHGGFDLIALKTICKRFDVWDVAMKAAYVRLGILPWGSDRALIRIARRKLVPSNLCDPALREARRSYYRAMLRHHSEFKRLTGLFHR